MSNKIIDLFCGCGGLSKGFEMAGFNTVLAIDFWKDAVYEVNGYNPKRKGTAHLLKQIGDTQIIVQRMSDNAIAKVDIESDQYEIMYPQMSEATFAEFMQGQDGFEKIDINSGFVCRESALFSLEKFVDDLVNDKLENVKKTVENQNSICYNII